MRSFIVCLEIFNGGYVYWSGYDTGAYGATIQALKSIKYDGVVYWIAENPVITFDIEGDDFNGE
jgi:hypothetical protein